MGKLEKRVFGLEVKVADLEKWTEAFRRLGTRRTLKVEALEGLMRELVPYILDESQDKEEEEMTGGAEGASRESLAGGFLNRLRAVAERTSELRSLALEVEGLTIGSSPPEDAEVAEKARSQRPPFIDKARGLLDAIGADLAEANRRLSRVREEFTCGSDGPKVERLSGLHDTDTTL